MNRGIVLTAIVACAVGWVGSSVFSDEPGFGGTKEEWTKFGEPVEQHARMKALAGEWAVHGKFVGFDGKEHESDSSASIQMIMGDRFLHQEVSGEFEGERFEGLGIMGYDKGTKRWTHAWVDNMGTAILVSDGEEAAPGKGWTFKGKFTGPRGVLEMRDVLTIVNEKEFTVESFIGESPKPMMTLHYKRK